MVLDPLGLCRPICEFFDSTFLKTSKTQMGVLQYLILLCMVSLISFSSVTLTQQPYEGMNYSNCDITDSSTSVFGYFCNFANPTCQSYLLYRSLSPYLTVSNIAKLFGSDASQLAKVNFLTGNEILAENRDVIVPINCSCSGQFSQADSSYVMRTGDTINTVANDILQGLTTCKAIQNVNNVSAPGVKAGQTITIPLRCACPTTNQSYAGIKYLLTYPVIAGDTLTIVSGLLGPSITEISAANELPGDQIYAVTTLLIPYWNTPTSLITSSPPPPPPPSSMPSSSPQTPTASNPIWLYVVIAVAASIGIMLAIFLIIFYLFMRKSRRRNEADPIINMKKTNDYSIITSTTSGSVETQSNIESSELLAGISANIASVKVYKFEDLQAATDNFSPECWISGSVYRGTINGDLAAVKKINGDVSKEINLLSKINHLNIIKLSGVCFNEGNWYFVYEYAINGSLSNWIHGNMSWTQRVQIALDVAKGLNYLHSYTNPPHVHMDIRSSNILLDSDFRPMIANFGLARSTEEQEEGAFALTKHIVGTKGYMAPEYLEDGLISPRLDVYAFGVVMLELISGKEVVSSQGEDTFLVDVLIGILQAENVEDELRRFIDPSLNANYPLDLALSLARLIQSCLSKNPGSRPDMDNIVQSLSIIVDTSLAWEAQTQQQFTGTVN